MSEYIPTPSLTPAMRAAADLEKYGEAMRTGNDFECIRIEQRWGLYGASPELVSSDLKRISEGRIPLLAFVEAVEGALKP